MIEWGNTSRFFENIECNISDWIASNRMIDYPYQFDIKLDQIHETGMAFVTFNDIDAKSGDYAPICETFEGVIRIYAKMIPFKKLIIPSIQYIEK